jgi:hypothetical protein
MATSNYAAAYTADRSETPPRAWTLTYVNHDSFHILDPNWGHLTIKISGHPPFPAQVILNGHEYVACQARKTGIAFIKEGNCFTTISVAADLPVIGKVAGPLHPGRTGGEKGKMSRIRDHMIFMFYGEAAIHCGDHLGRYAVAATLRRPELDRHFDPLKAVSGEHQGKRVDEDGGFDARVMG